MWPGPPCGGGFDVRRWRGSGSRATSGSAAPVRSSDLRIRVACSAHDSRSRESPRWRAAGCWSTGRASRHPANSLHASAQAPRTHSRRQRSGRRLRVSVSASQSACCAWVQPSSSQSMRPTSGLGRRSTSHRSAIAEAPGFIRRVNFTDGPHYTLIASGGRPPPHASASPAPSTRRQCATCSATVGSTPTSPHSLGDDDTAPAPLFCQQCDGVTPATEPRCVGCGAELFDPFRSPARPST